MRRAILFFFAIALLLSCQQSPPDSDSSAAVRLRFPQSLKEPLARWDRFLARVIQLEVTVRSGAEERRLVAGPLSWKDLTIADWKPPAGEATVDIEARIWDRTAEGVPRNYPVASGKTRIKAGDWALRREIPLRLSLQVSVREYD